MPATLNTFTANTTIESSKVNENFTNLSARIRPTFFFPVDEILSVGTNKTPVLIATNTLTIEKVYAVVKTAPVGASLIMDININGSSIWATNQANRITINSGSTTGTSSAFDTTALSENDQLTLDIDQVGSGTAGANLTVALKCS